ncbi:MAG: HIT family protein [Sterolibacterium sp.]|nr:HIT family protein [Sterolibacterium sp.]
MCQPAGGDILWKDARCRVVRVGGAEGTDYPGFCRVIWREHVREMSDLTSADRRHLMAVVFATESALRALYKPEKINLASLGNVVPHLHWHVIPRFDDDPHFPAPIWAGKKRRRGPASAQPIFDDLALHEAINSAFSADQAGNS